MESDETLPEVDLPIYELLGLLIFNGHVQGLLDFFFFSYTVTSFALKGEHLLLIYLVFFKFYIR